MQNDLSEEHSRPWELEWVYLRQATEDELTRYRGFSEEAAKLAESLSLQLSKQKETQVQDTLPVPKYVHKVHRLGFAIVWDSVLECHVRLQEVDGGIGIFVLSEVQIADAD